MKRLPYQEMRLNEVIWLVYLFFGDFKYSPFKSYLRGCSSTEFMILVFCNFLVQGQTRVWISRRFNHPKNFDPGIIRCPLRRRNFLCNQIFQIPKFVETLISSKEEEEGVSPCESSLNQASSDTMLIFHMVD